MFKLTKWLIAGWIIGIVGSIAFWSGIAYIGLHFLAKIW